MQWILVGGLLLGLLTGSGNLQERLSHRIDHGALITTLEIDRDVVLVRSERNLLVSLRVFCNLLQCPRLRPEPARCGAL